VFGFGLLSLWIILVLGRQEAALVLSCLLQPRVALPRNHAVVAFLLVRVGFAVTADSCCVSRHFLYLATEAHKLS
jgi:hypothetical protein